MRLAQKLCQFLSLSCFSISCLGEKLVDSAVGLEEKPNIANSLSTTAKPLVATPELSGVSNWPLIVVSLLGIIALIFCLAWFAKRFGGFGSTGSGDMRVIAAIPLGARERVALVDVKGQQFMLGVTAQNINHLHTFDEPVIDLNRTPKSEFAHKLQGILKAQNPKSHASD